MKSEEVEINEGRPGPTLPYSSNRTWRDHLALLALLVVYFIIITAVAHYNLTLLHKFNPGYRHNLAEERAFCAEIDKTFVNSKWAFDETDYICKLVEEYADVN